VAPGTVRPPTRRWREIGRRVVGVVGAVVITAYGAGAAVSVAVSDEETVVGKSGDGLAAVSVLKDRYEAAKYVAEHRQQIQDALDYVDQNTPPQEDLERAAAQTSETLSSIGKTFAEVRQAREALGDIHGPRSLVREAPEVYKNVREAFDARPSLDSLDELGARAEQAAPYVEQARVLSGDYLEDVLHAVDNFSSDEIVGTIGLMAAALGMAFVLAHAIGFWARRGRPGLLARTLQRWGAHRFRGWYVDHLPHALSPPVYAAARERLQRDIVADPQEALDPDVLRELELWFANRSEAVV
jgi:hypothetical protein